MTEATIIEKPWVIAHEIEGGRLQVLLVGPDYAKHQHFGIVIADIIGHVAGHFDMDVQDVLDWVQREIDDPTTTLERLGPN
jgi:hypothetical protein